MHRPIKLQVRPIKRILAATALLVAASAVPALRPFAVAPLAVRASAGCSLSPAQPNIKHLIYIQFDNTHFMRDPARDGTMNVPSDLEQMPHLLNFIENNGTLLSNHHTPLISHTSDDIITSETGVYPSRHGIATAANSYYYYNGSGTPARQTGFTYWTDKIGDGQYNVTSAPNTNAPAPWVPFTRAGCNVGGVGMADMEIENTGVDLSTVFGPGSPQTTDPNAFANYLGIAVHCAQGDALCASGNGGYADKLPNEPNPDGTAASTDASGTSTAYQGYNALFGHKYVTQAFQTTGYLTPTQNLQDINGNTIVDDFQGSITPGFPGFSLAPQYSLGYVAAMQEAGVPVTFAYVITPHNPLPANPYGYGHPGDNHAYGPGEANYVDQLKQYDDAFNTFFTRLNNDGINSSNTLFVFTSDEGDHNINGLPTPLTCDGVTVPCTYSQSGELATYYNGLLQAEQGFSSTVAASATVNNDDAPDIYLKGNPAPADPRTRTFERATGALTVTNPISTALGVPSTDQLTQYMADAAEYKILHMYTADPLRTPSFTAFAQPDYYVQQGSTCGTSATPSTACVTQNPAFNWNHGDVQPQISTTWLGLVGPGVLPRGIDGPGPSAAPTGTGVGTFADHVDIRPTMLSLLGLKDDYVPDGRLLAEDLSRVPAAVQADETTFIRLARVYKQINAPVGQLGTSTLISATQALESGSAADDSAYTQTEQRLDSIRGQRDTLAISMTNVLNGATFDNQPIDDPYAQCLIVQGDELLTLGMTTGGCAPTTTQVGTDTPVPPTSSSTAAPTNTSTPVPPTSTSTVAPTNTNTPVPPTSTSTAAPTETSTPVPPTATSTVAPTNTSTPVPPTSTSTVAPTNTSTPVPPTATNTVAPTETSTPVPPTATNTAMPTETSTPVPPTSTPTPRCKPGHGYGDKNHCHSGPPGHDGDDKDGKDGKDGKGHSDRR